MGKQYLMQPSGSGWQDRRQLHRYEGLLEGLLLPKP